MEAAHSLASPLGRISKSHDAVAHIVGRVAAEAYGVVAMAPRNPRDRLTRDRFRQGMEYGLNLAEVASTLRNRVRYEIERLMGLSVAEVDVRIQDVRRSTA